MRRATWRLANSLSALSFSLSSDRGVMQSHGCLILMRASHWVPSLHFMGKWTLRAPWITTPLLSTSSLSSLGVGTSITTVCPGRSVSAADLMAGSLSTRVLNQVATAAFLSRMYALWASCALCGVRGSRRGLVGQEYSLGERGAESLPCGRCPLRTGWTGARARR
jgi:hypothetical protein